MVFQYAMSRQHDFHLSLMPRAARQPRCSCVTAILMLQIHAGMLCSVPAANDGKAVDLRCSRRMEPPVADPKDGNATWRSQGVFKARAMHTNAMWSLGAPEGTKPPVTLRPHTPREVVVTLSLSACS